MYCGPFYPAVPLNLGIPRFSGADAACPGYRSVLLIPGTAALSLPDHLTAVANL